MVQVQSFPVSSFRLMSSALRAGVFLVAQVAIGALLLLVAGMAALMTALAGVTLAAAALAIRFAASPRTRASAPVTDTSSVTLEARRTPRGWTVE
jgi:hypothetical protein